MRLRLFSARFLTSLCIVPAAFGLAMTPIAATAQVTEIDPNSAIDADLAPQSNQNSMTTPQEAPYSEPSYQDPAPAPSSPPQNATADGTQPGTLPPEIAADQARVTASYQKDDLIGAAEGVFGKGAEGLAGIIENILRDQGEPNGYIVGREAAGAFVVGLRYGSGTLYHKVEGEMPVYWTGPSIGFDAGANAGNTFILVYNLYNTEDLFKRYGAGEGAAYLVGGFNSSYLRRGDVVLIPVRLGVGVRLGANVGYMKFSKNRTWLPF